VTDFWTHHCRGHRWFQVGSTLPPMPSLVTPLTSGYLALKKNQEKRCLRSFSERVLAVCRDGRQVLQRDCTRIELISVVAGKTYFAYQRTHVSARNLEAVYTSRPINAALYVTDETEFDGMAIRFVQGNYAPLGELEATRLLYTLAMSFCAANDVLTKGDKKTPATFFELFVSHLFSRRLGVLPTKKIRVPAAEDVKVDLPTDLIFDPGASKAKFHVPVKLSTRERVIQAWAHQRVIEGIWGTTEYKGILVVLTETKLNLSNHEVTEICLPNQWRIYQRYIAHMKRVYYLDPPAAYTVLSQGNPRIDVKPLGAFFTEQDELFAR
jgi:hypothetical protein